MRNTTLQYVRKPDWLLLLASMVWVFSCQTAEPVATIAPDPTTIISPTLVSAQALGNDQAEFVVKAGFEFDPSSWRLNLLDANKRSMALNAGTVGRLDLFTLMPYRITGLISGQTYRLRFVTRNAGGDSVHVERDYVHRPDGPRWTRLAHAPVAGGDFAGSAMSTDNVPGSDASQLSIWQLKSDNSYQALSYSVGSNSWYAYKLTTSSTLGTHGIVRFSLQAVKGVVYSMSGLGFVTNESLPGQRQYLKNMVTPDFAGPDGEVRWFTTLTKAYQLVEGGHSQVWVRMGTWDQYRTADLPEPTGTLATFRIGTTGYVVNQRSGQAAHLWAFDTEREQWSRKADFPGAIRSRGIGFQADEKGFFGLGITPNEETLRDVWQYNPATDKWQYVTDYPGAGSTYLVVSQIPGHTFLGWGYEQQPTAAGGIRLVGCTDFWEFKP
ncbi:hypothetical protein IC229_26550 [Spirosoma sp. BT702]|uniref:Galactose oxidase n=1 Tax=Spirosoma profusum TaxID=2771354 RepID=A0A927AUG8_9BACT|nr:hypothetical protein [Spirosoma profusum]MBD2704232.1 hypothetical protein [Spirosoma profusum]